MLKKSGLVFLATVLAVVLFCVSLSVALADDYVPGLTNDVTIPANGVAHVDQSSTVGGVSIDIAGTPGAVGSVTTATYSGNPQAGATIPEDTTLTHFVVITFNFSAADFGGASITISYSDAEVAGISLPFGLYKYIPESDSYVKLTAVVDTGAKTITTTVSSTTDPLFAIGGVPVAEEPGWALPALAIVSITVIVIAVVAIVVAILLNRRKPSFQMIKD